MVVHHIQRSLPFHTTHKGRVTSGRGSKSAGVGRRTHTPPPRLAPGYEHSWHAFLWVYRAAEPHPHRCFTRPSHPDSLWRWAHARVLCLCLLLARPDHNIASTARRQGQVRREDTRRVAAVREQVVWVHARALRVACGHVCDARALIRSCAQRCHPSFACAAVCARPPAGPHRHRCHLVSYPLRAP